MAHTTQTTGEASAQLEPSAPQVISAEALLATDDLEVVYIPLPAPWQGGIKARPLTMLEIHQMRKAATRQVRKSRTGKLEEEYDLTLANVELVRLSLVEPALTQEQVKALMTKNAKLMRAILDALNRLSAIEQEDVEEAVAEAEAEF